MKNNIDYENSVLFLSRKVCPRAQSFENKTENRMRNLPGAIGGRVCKCRAVGWANVIRHGDCRCPLIAPSTIFHGKSVVRRSGQREIKADPYEKTGGEPPTLPRFRRDIVKNDRTHELATEISCRKVYDHFAPSCTNALFPYFIVDDLTIILSRKIVSFILISW